MLLCRDVARRAQAYLDDELTAVMRWRFTVHLVLCRSCRRHLHHLRLLSGALGRLGPDEGPREDEVERVLARLQQHRE